MPIYEYACNKCGKTFEKMESINNDETVKKCEKCGGEAHRIISHSAFHLKGGGWASTEYSKCSSSSGGSSCPVSKGEAPACGSCCATSK